MIDWTPTALNIGEQAVEVLVNDGRGGEATQSFIITVRDNHPPVITSSPVLITNVGEHYNYNAIATDPDNDILSYELTTFPQGMLINDTGLITFTSTLEQVGQHTVTVQVADPGGLQASQTYTLSVENNNLPPVITSAPVISTTELENYQYQVQATDPNPNDVLSYGLNQYADGMSIDPATGIVGWLPSELIIPFNEIENPYCSAPVQIDSPYWNVSDWQILRDAGGHAGVQDWSILDDGMTAKAIGNGDPSILLSDIELSDAAMEVSIKITGGDNDAVGFVWGFQDARHYYRLRWLQDDVGLGLQVTKINSSNPRYGGTDETDIDLFQNKTLTWEHHTEYRFLIDVKPGHTAIFLLEGDAILESIQIKDDSYLTGKFGFYVQSQGGVFYSAKPIDRQPAADLIIESVELETISDTQDRIDLTVRNRGAVATEIDVPVVLLVFRKQVHRLKFYRKYRGDDVLRRNYKQVKLTTG